MCIAFGDGVGAVAEQVPDVLDGNTFLAKPRCGRAAFMPYVGLSLVVNEPIGSLPVFNSVAHTPCKATHFLTLRKDANPDIPILKQAKGEYAKLGMRRN